MQRSRFKRNLLDPTRAERLAALPRWTWDSRAAWEEGYGHLERYVAREHDARVPATHTENGYPLGQWVTRQRQVYIGGRLAADRIARLEALPGWEWDTRQTDYPPR